ncbi:unnamed protein product, partial [marine sediment metagenome]
AVIINQKKLICSNILFIDKSRISYVNLNKNLLNYSLSICKKLNLFL